MSENLSFGPEEEPSMTTLEQLCSVEGCDKVAARRGYCHMHNKRLRLHGRVGGARPMVELHGMRHSPEYGVWAGMIDRCSNPGATSWPNYGARGISVCDRWLHSFTAFYEDMGPRPSAQHSIERRNTNGSYEPLNCYWATRLTQNLNTRLRRNSKSGYRGVSWKSANLKWVATISGVHIGYYDDSIEAAWMYDQFAIQLWGDDARPNFEYMDYVRITTR